MKPAVSVGSCLQRHRRVSQRQQASEAMQRAHITKFMKLSELERRQAKAKAEAKARQVAQQASAAKEAAARAAALEERQLAAEVEKIDAATAAAARKKAILIESFCKGRGCWAGRAKDDLEALSGVLDAVETLQRAGRKQVSCE